MNNPLYIIIHSSDVSEKREYDQFRSINAYHKSKGFPLSSKGIYVGYHRLITGGKNYVCRNDTEIGAHTKEIVDGKSMNEQSLGICWGGDGDIEYPSPEHLNLLREQIRSWQEFWKIPDYNVKPHRLYNIQKTCPGSLLSNEWLKCLVARKDPEQEEKAKIELLTTQLSLLQKLYELLKQKLFLNF